MPPKLSSGVLARHTFLKENNIICSPFLRDGQWQRELPQINGRHLNWFYRIMLASTWFTISFFLRIGFIQKTIFSKLEKVLNVMQRWMLLLLPAWLCSKPHCGQYTTHFLYSVHVSSQWWHTLSSCYICHCWTIWSLSLDTWNNFIKYIDTERTNSRVTIYFKIFTNWAQLFEAD